MKSFQKLSLKFQDSRQQRYSYFNPSMRLQIHCDFQKYLNHFSSSNIKKVTKILRNGGVEFYRLIQRLTLPTS